MSCNSCNTPYRTNGYYLYPDNCIALPIQSTNLVYDGPNLPCSGIRTCNTITVALQKIDEKLCSLAQEIQDCCNPTTTTTTTNVENTTTTTSSSSTTTTTTTYIADCELNGDVFTLI